MIRHELQMTSLRFYATESTDPFHPYDAICTLMWESPTVVWIKGLHGNLTRKMLRELVAFCKEHKIERIKAHRSLERAVPFAKSLGGNTIEIDIASIGSRKIDNEE